MKDTAYQLEDVAIQERIRAIHDSWTPEERQQRLEEGKRRRAALVRLLLRAHDSFPQNSSPHDATVHPAPARESRRAVTQRYLARRATRVGA